MIVASLFAGSENKSRIWNPSIFCYGVHDYQAVTLPRRLADDNAIFFKIPSVVI